MFSVRNTSLGAGNLICKRPITPTLTTVFHATSVEAAHRILSGKGILPRAIIGTDSRYDDFPSNEQCVYMSYSHGAYFAGSIAGGEHAPSDCRRGKRGLVNAAIIEVDASQLDSSLCFPDEDYLEQAGRGLDDIPGDIFRRTDHYRNCMFEHASRFKECFESVGSIAYRGVVPVQLIKRVAFIDWDMIDAQQLMAIYSSYFENQPVAKDIYQYTGASQRELTELFCGSKTRVNGQRFRMKNAIKVVNNKKYRNTLQSAVGMSKQGLLTRLEAE